MTLYAKFQPEEVIVTFVSRGTSTDVVVPAGTLLSEVENYGASFWNDANGMLCAPSLALNYDITLYESDNVAVVTTLDEFKDAVKGDADTIVVAAEIPVTETLVVDRTLALAAKDGGSLIRPRSFTDVLLSIETPDDGEATEVTIGNLLIDGKNIKAEAPAVFVDGSSSLILNGATIQNNINTKTYGDNEGGGIYSNGKVYMYEGTTICSNVASAGGGICIDCESEEFACLYLYGGDICHNQAWNNGCYGGGGGVKITGVYDRDYTNNGTGEYQYDVLYLLGEVATAKDSMFEYDGYRFLGWNTRADGTGHWYYPDFNGYNKVTMDRAVLIFAQWEMIVGDLSVSNTVKGVGADPEKEFTFTVTLSDTTINGTYGDLTFEDGVATFTLKDGESKTATGLPAGITYTVTEDIASADGYEVATAEFAGTVEDGATAEAPFVNTKKAEPEEEPEDEPDEPEEEPEEEPEDIGGIVGPGEGGEPVEIEEPETPLAEMPADEPATEPEEFEELPEEEVPLAGVPETSEKSGIWALLAMAAASLLAVLELLRKKKTEE